MQEIKAFRIHLKRLGYSQGSQNMLPTCIAEFLAQMEAQGITDLKQIESHHIQSHYNYLCERPNQRREGD